MAISHLLEKLSTEMNSTVGALDLPEGTNYSDIARMAVEGEISTGDGKQFKEIEFDTMYSDYDMEISEHDAAVLDELLTEYESGDTDLIVVRYVDNAEGIAPDIFMLSVWENNDEKACQLISLACSYQISYSSSYFEARPMWGPVTWADMEYELQVQYNYIPDPSDLYWGRIIQYNGADWEGYKTGYFYQCVEVPDSDPQEFTWEQIDVQPASGGTEPTVRFLGHYSEFNTQEKAIDLAKLEKNVIYIINDLDYPSTNKKVYVKASTSVYGSAKTFTTTILDSSKSSISNGLYLKRIDDIPAEYSSPKLIATFWNEAIWDTTGNLMRDMYYINLQSDRLSYSGNAYCLISGLGTGAQTIDGVKTFTSIPKVNSYTAPTTNTQLAAKKYVDDVASNFLAIDNTNSFTPVGDYNPSTKKYVDDTVYGVNSYMTTGDPKLIGYYNGRNIWRKTFEYTQSTIQNWTAETPGADFSTYLIQLPTDYDNVEFVINSHADADVYLGDISTSVDISNTFDPLDPIMSCQLLQFIKSGPDGHQYFRLLLGDDVKDHATKISITIEWIEAHVVIA